MKLVPSIINYLNNLKLSLKIKKQIKDTLKIFLLEQHHIMIV